LAFDVPERYETEDNHKTTKTVDNHKPTKTVENYKYTRKLQTPKTPQNVLDLQEYR
jgi:hypothetical protein